MQLRGLSRQSLIRSFFVLAFVFIACHLSQDGTVENTLSFSKNFDSLSKYDSVVIEVKDPEGKLLAVVFSGKADSRGELEHLDVPGWDGGPISIVISGFKTGNPDPVYQEVKGYNGKTRVADTPVVLIHPNPGLSAASLSILLHEGQSQPLPLVTVTPANLANAGLKWSSDNAGVAAVQGGNLVGVSLGSARLTVKLVLDSAKTLTFDVQVQADPAMPTSLALDRDTLYLAQDGAHRRFGIEVRPSAASAEVSWRLSDSTVAALQSDGAFAGLKKGLTKAWAASKRKPSLVDSGYILVSEPVLVASVRFLMDSLVLFVGGAPESLDVEVLPAQANSEVLFSLSDNSKATLAGGILSPKAAGSLSVTVRSKEDTSKSDVLAVTIREPVGVQKVEASKDTLVLFTKGPAHVLTAKVSPDSAPQSVRWNSLTSAVASVQASTGEVSPLQPGLALIVVRSLADSNKRDTVQVSVKTDPPQLDIGRDTTVSTGTTVVFHPVVTQAYGQVVMFKWDLNGDLAWDDSSASLRDVSFKYEQTTVHSARFLVRDTEGNEPVVTRRITVASGAAVSIDSPKDNSYTNLKRITVEWSVNGKPQDSLQSEDLKAGPNIITRSARDSAGKVFTVSITVHLDTLPPLKPNLSGTSPTSVKPKWTWSSGGGGSGDFRFRLADGNFPANAPTTRDTVHTLAADPVSGTTYTLFVQERDAAGNWSPSSSLAIVYDVTKPVVTIASPRASGTHYTSSAGVVLSGTATGPLPIARVTYKVGAAAAVNATSASGAWNTPSIPLQEGAAVAVTITAIDNAGNSGEASLTLFMDNTPPAAPTINLAPSASVNVLMGTWSWTPGSDGASGSGLNGRYRYNLNSGAWKDTSATLLSNLPLVTGDNIFSVQEQDKAGLWSTSATSVVKVDTEGPLITLVSHLNPANLGVASITLSGEVQDAGTGVSSMSVAGQGSGSGTVIVTGSTWTTASLALASGANTLVLTAKDKVGNSRTLNVVVNVNIPAPKVIATNPSDNSTLTRLDTLTVHYTVDGSPTSKLFNLTEGANSLIVSSSPNASGNIGRDTVVVTRDATPPLSPTLNPVTSPTNGKATWTWVSRGDNAGGEGVRTPARFRYQVNSEPFTETGATQLERTAEGSYTVVVQEQDKAGNWSPSSTARTIVVDVTKPVVTITSPASGFITNQTSITINYTEKDGSNPAVNKSQNVNLPNDNAANTATVTSTADAAGNTGSASITVWRRSGVLFVNPGATGTPKDGSSWSNGFATLQQAISQANVSSRKQIWLANGTYKTPSKRGFDLGSGVSIYGGFAATSVPVQITQRDSIPPYSTILSPSTTEDTVIFIDRPGELLANIGLNSLQIEGYGMTAIYGRGLLRDFRFENLDIQKFSGYNAVSVWGTGTFKKCNFHHNSTQSSVLDVMPENWSGLTGMEMFDCTFSDNMYGGNVLFFLNGSLTIHRSNFLDYGTGAWQLGSNAPFPEAIVTYLSCTVRGGREAMFHPGTLNYDGSNTTIP